MPNACAVHHLLEDEPKHSQNSLISAQAGVWSHFLLRRERQLAMLSGAQAVSRDHFSLLH